MKRRRRIFDCSAHNAKCFVRTRLDCRIDRTGNFDPQKSPLKGFAVAGGVTLLVCAATLLIGQNVEKRLPELFF
jgi:hypothetical protein